MEFHYTLHSIKPPLVIFSSLEEWKLILAYTHTSSKIPLENVEACLFDSSKTYIILDNPMKEHIPKYILIEYNLWAGIPKSFLDLYLTLLKLDLDWAMFADFMTFTEVFDHILRRGIGKCNCRMLMGT